MRRTATIRARTYVILARLSKAGLNETLKDSPEQRVIMLARIRSFNNIAQPGADEKSEEDSADERSSEKCSPDTNENRNGNADEVLSPMSLGPVTKKKCNGAIEDDSTRSQVGSSPGPKDAWIGAGHPLNGVVPAENFNGDEEDSEDEIDLEPDSPLMKQAKNA
jgi:hypothetical protein